MVKMIGTSIKIPEAMIKKIDKKAKALGVGRTTLFKIAVAEYLDREAK